MSLLAVALPVAWSFGPPGRVRPPRRAPCPRCQQPPDAAASFQTWMEASCPPGAVPRNYSLAAGASVSTTEGALASVWHAVCENLERKQFAPSLSVCLLPSVPLATSLAGMDALERHLLACRDCCAGFGRSLRLQSLHPESDAGRASPVPALALTNRVGPPLTLEVGEDGAETDEELQKARAALERLILIEGEREAMEASDVLGEVTAWFAAKFAAVHRIVGGRQRRRVVRGGAEELYRAFWAEAARLVGEAPLAPDDADTLGASEGAPLSSLLVLPGLDQATEFRKLHRSLALGLATLQLEQRLSISAFHPADTYEILESEDGTRQWRQTLAHPLMHIVCKVPPPQRVQPTAAPKAEPAAGTTDGGSGGGGGGNGARSGGGAALRGPAPPVQLKVVRTRVGGAAERVPRVGNGMGPLPPAGFEWGLSL